jgi:DNA-binding PucR family transcriptional regulator
VRYEDLGTYRAVLPFARSAEMRHFAEQVLDPLADHDIENNTALLETLTGYVLAGCTFKAAAAVLAQHENTIRYRMDKVSDITGLSYKEHDQLEVLSLAVKIREAGRLLEELEG